MRGRVTLPRATIVYQPHSLAVADADARGFALAGKLYEVATTSLFMLLNLLAAALPWLLVIGPLVWLIRRWRTQRQKVRLDESPPPP